MSIKRKKALCHLTLTNLTNDLPLLPPPNAQLEQAPILKKCIEARGLLGELEEVGKRIPNQSVLINSIPLLEAKSSAEKVLREKLNKWNH